MQLFDESTLGPSARSALVTGISKDTTYYFRIFAVDTKGENLSDPSDTYGLKTGSGTRYLIVDGFSRITGSYVLPYHSFSASYGEPLAILGRWFDSADNDALISGELDPTDYAGLIWFVGDNSVADRSLNPTEQQIVTAYLEGGGRLFLTGSEIGFDIGRSASANQNIPWYADNLKAVYEGDDAAGLAYAGSPGSVFDGLSGQFGQVYPEDYPDYISPTGGSSRSLDYNSTRYAGVQYSGPFGTSANEAKMIYIGFAFETIASLSQRQSLLERALTFFEGSLHAEGPDAHPSSFQVSQNFPNPFNPTTTIEFSIPRTDRVTIVIHDLLGREIAVLLNEDMAAGFHRVAFNGRSLPSGTYYYTVRTTVYSKTRRMVLLK
jgi:hypothetical protein